MAKRFEYWSGKAKWVRAVTPDQQYNKYSMMLYPDPPSLAKIWELKKGTGGIKNPIGKDDDGEYIRLSRPASKLMRGKIVTFAPPVVLDRDNNPLPRDTMVGNGSDVTCKVEVYGYSAPGASSKSNALRWEALRVDNLIPYTRDDFDDGQKEQVEGLPEQANLPAF
jgi:hypothetical protein